MDNYTLTLMKQLEAESIHVMRETVAECERPVMLYSTGKDSCVMLQLARKAFAPGKIPFPLLHVDTTFKFREMYEFRDRTAEEMGVELIVHKNEKALDQIGHNASKWTCSLCADLLKTQGLIQALQEGGFDAAFGGGRRDEEKSRAKERILSFRDRAMQWDPKSQRPELWALYNMAHAKGESFRVFPLSNWTELDVWTYIHLESIPIVPLYFAAERDYVVREGLILRVGDLIQPTAGEKVHRGMIRYRTLGCQLCTGAVASEATTLEQIIAEVVLARNSEREGRAVDQDREGAMEAKKAEGYF